MSVVPKHVRTLKAKRAARVLPKLVALREQGTATAAQVGITPVDALSLSNEGLIKSVDKERTGQRGRPALVYRLTDKGLKRAKRVS